MAGLGRFGGVGTVSIFMRVIEAHEKHLGLAMVEALREQRAGAVYLSHDLVGAGPVPGTERLIWLWRPDGEVCA